MASDKLKINHKTQKIKPGQIHKLKTIRSIISTSHHRWLKGFKKYYISIAVEWTGVDMLWNGSEDGDGDNDTDC